MTRLQKEMRDFAHEHEACTMVEGIHKVSVGIMVRDEDDFWEQEWTSCFSIKDVRDILGY